MRNKIVTAITGSSGVIVAAERVFPGLIPPGTGDLVAQLGVFAALLANVAVQR